MAPPQAHVSIAVWFTIGLLLTSTVGMGGTHGAGMTGTQGIGVRTPSAAAVAEATVGFAIDMHIPNGGTFAMGLFWSKVAGNFPSNMTMSEPGITTNVDGAAPNEQRSWADMTSGSGMKRF